MIHKIINKENKIRASEENKQNTKGFNIISVF